MDRTLYHYVHPKFISIHVYRTKTCTKLYLTYWCTTLWEPGIGSYVMPFWFGDVITCYTRCLIVTVIIFITRKSSWSTHQVTSCSSQFYIGAVKIILQSGIQESASLNLPRVVPIFNGSSSSHTKHYVYTQQPGVPILQLPPFLLNLRNQPVSPCSGPQVQCSLGESVRPPTSDIVSTLQDRLRLTADTTTKVNDADHEFNINTTHNPVAIKHTNSCTQSPLNRIKSECIPRQHSQTSQSSAETLIYVQYHTWVSDYARVCTGMWLKRKQIVPMNFP